MNKFYCPIIFVLLGLPSATLLIIPGVSPSNQLCKMHMYVTRGVGGGGAGLATLLPVMLQKTLIRIRNEKNATSVISFT